MGAADDRKNLILLLQKHGSNKFATGALAFYIADKAFEDGHLYSDMGLDSRVRLGRLMEENYPTLSIQKPPNIRWKKFLFDSIGSIAPACKGCKDISDCFRCDRLEAG